MAKRPPSLGDDDGDALMLKRSKTQDENSEKPCRLLMLPRELRDEIYRLVYGESSKAVRPRHPYDPYPPNPPSPTSTVWLPILNRQIRDETLDLLKTEYDQTFYCQDVPALYRFVKEMKDRNIAPHTKFSLRRRTDPGRPRGRENMEEAHWKDYEYQGLSRKVTRDFIEAQEGFQHQYNCALGYHPWAKGDLDWLWKRRETIQRLKFREETHEDCPKTDKKCRRYFTCEYPPLAGSLRLRGYAWEHKDMDYKLDVEYAGGLVLEGRICDVSFEKYLERCEAADFAPEDGYFDM